MRMKTLACCRRRPQDFSIDMDQEPDSKQTSLPVQDLPDSLPHLYRFLPASVPLCLVRFWFVLECPIQSWISCTACEIVRGWALQPATCDPFLESY
jgi:hypothetical protein